MGPTKPQVRVRLLDAEGQRVAQSEGVKEMITIPSVHLWQPGEGYLYQDLVIEISESEELVDSYAQKVGVRTVEVRGFEFLINGKPAASRDSACMRTILFAARARTTCRWSTTSSC